MIVMTQIMGHQSKLMPKVMALGLIFVFLTGSVIVNDLSSINKDSVEDIDDLDDTQQDMGITKEDDQFTPQASETSDWLKPGASFSTAVQLGIGGISIG